MSFRANNCRKRFVVGHVKENARHDVQKEIAANGHAAQAKESEHHIKCTHENHGLRDIRQQAEDGVAMGFAHLANRCVVHKRQKGNQAANLRFPVCLYKHRVAAASQVRVARFLRLADPVAAKHKGIEDTLQSVVPTRPAWSAI